MDGVFFITATFDFVAILIVLGMCMLPGNVGEKDDFGTGLFIGMGGCIIAGAVFELISRNNISWLMRRFLICAMKENTAHLPLNFVRILKPSEACRRSGKTKNASPPRERLLTIRRMFLWPGRRPRMPLSKATEKLLFCGLPISVTGHTDREQKRQKTKAGLS